MFYGDCDLIKKFDFGLCGICVSECCKADMTILFKSAS